MGVVITKGIKGYGTLKINPFPLSGGGYNTFRGHGHLPRVARVLKLRRLVNLNKHSQQARGVRISAFFSSISRGVIRRVHNKDLIIEALPNRPLTTN